MRFCPNISMLWSEVGFLERFARAREAGFGAVEFWWPTGEDLDEVEAAVRDAGLEVALFNFDAGDMPAGDRGFLSDPNRHEQFKENVPVALDLAERLGCPRLNALVGHDLEGVDTGEQMELARTNVAEAADQAAGADISILIEAVNTFENGPYLLWTTQAAADFVEGVGRDNVRLLYDAYHLQRMQGNLVASLREHSDRVAHIQVADSPDRGEPGTGEINYRFVLEAIEGLGYDGFVGLEYGPTTEATEDSLGWLPEAARGQDVGAADLRL